MTSTQLPMKCKQMLARREAPASVWFYVKHNWQRQLFFAIAYLTMAGALWSINWRSISVAFMAYFMGRTVRHSMVSLTSKRMANYGGTN